MIEIQPNPRDELPPAAVQETDEQPDVIMEEASKFVDALQFRGAFDKSETQLSQEGALLNDQMMTEVIDASNDVARGSLTSETVVETDGSFTWGAAHDACWGRPMLKSTQNTIRVNADGSSAVHTGSQSHVKAMGFVTVQQ